MFFYIHHLHILHVFILSVFITSNQCFSTFISLYLYISMFVYFYFIFIHISIYLLLLYMYTLSLPTLLHFSICCRMIFRVSLQTCRRLQWLQLQNCLVFVKQSMNYNYIILNLSILHYLILYYISFTNYLQLI